MSLLDAAERFANIDHSAVTLDKERCLHSQDRFSGCEACFDICPVSAITLGKPPGYYSLSRQINPAESTLDFQLVPHPETRRVSWGNGEVILSPETNVTVNDSDLDLERGWLWGSGGRSHPLRIHLPGLEVSVSNGKFALESPAGGGTARLYIYKGKAQVIYCDSGTPIELDRGEMIALVDGARPIPMDEPVAAGLHPTLNEAPIPEVIEPLFKARFENWLVKAGIGAAQAITFITYILSLAALVGIPLFALFWGKKKRKNPSGSEKNS